MTGRGIDLSTPAAIAEFTERKQREAKARGNSQPPPAPAEAGSAAGVESEIGVVLGDDAPSPAALRAWFMAEGPEIQIAGARLRRGTLSRAVAASALVYPDAPLPELQRTVIHAIADAWKHRPKAIAANLRADRIIPAKLAMFAGTGRRAGLFSPARHRGGEGGQLELPGFGRDIATPALPLALYDLGMQRTAAGPGAPLALRIFVEAILSVPVSERESGPVALSIPCREFIRRLWPNRRPKPGEYRAQLERARAALASEDAGIPWPGGRRWAVLMSNVPVNLDDEVRVIVDLPPSAKAGPQVSPNLHLYGPRDAKAYRGLLNLAYWWHDPGTTRIPIEGGRLWVQSRDPRRYCRLTDDELVNLIFPTSTRRQRRNLTREANATIARLADAGELQIVAGKVLPPDRDEPTE